MLFSSVSKYSYWQSGHLFVLRKARFLRIVMRIDADFCGEIVIHYVIVVLFLNIFIFSSVSMPIVPIWFKVYAWVTLVNMPRWFLSFEKKNVFIFYTF